MPGNSLLVTFELTPSGAGRCCKMTETGFREMGWEVAVLEEQYQRARRAAGTSTCRGWRAYAATLAARP